MSNSFTIIGFIAESTPKLKTSSEVTSLRMRPFTWKLFPNLVLFVNTIYTKQQLRIFVIDFLNLVLVCKDVEPGYGRTRTGGFFSAVRVVSLTTCMLSISLLEDLFIKCSGLPFFKKIYVRQTNWLCNLVQLKHIRDHL